MCKVENPQPVKHPMTIQDGGIEKRIYRSDPFQNDVCTAAGLAREVSFRRRTCLLANPGASCLGCHRRTAKDLARRLHLSCKCTARTRKENLSFFSFRLKPWPNGTASRRKLKTWIHLRHRLVRPCVHLG